MEEPEQPPKGSPLATACIVIALIGVFALMAFAMMIGNIQQQLTMH